MCTEIQKEKEHQCREVQFKVASKKNPHLFMGFFMWFYIPCQVGNFPLQLCIPREASEGHRRLLTKGKGALQ